jgi:rhamnulokinase
MRRRDVSWHAAIDLGAGSGRALVGRVEEDTFLVEEVHRFRYAPRHADGHLRWDIGRLFEGVRAGVLAAGRRAAADGAAIASVGVDSWGVDYGLIDSDGRLTEEPICYRDDRTNGMMERVFASVPRQEIYSRTGIQFHQLNTLYQLAAHVRDGLPSGAARLLLIPDLCHHLLCGATVSERSDASTTQMLNVRTGRWDDDLIARLRLPGDLMPPLVSTGADLVGVERTAPMLTREALDANFTNEIGAFGTVRFLKNVMGLWLLESCRREWDAAGGGMALADLLARVSAVGDFAGLVAPDDPRFFNPASMVREIRAALGDTGQEAHDDPVLLSRVITDSLALRYASVVTDIERVTGSAVTGIHVVGGGSLNDCLSQATADATGRPVAAGPAEATAIGNILVQAVSTGVLPSLAHGRELVRHTSRPRHFEPQATRDWKAAAARYAAIDAEN